VVTKKYAKSHADWEKYAIVALTSLYGVELLQDNVEECRERLLAIFEEVYAKTCKKDVNAECLDAARFILQRNILCGDALTLTQADGKPIIFSEWSFIKDSLIQRRDFRLDEMIAGTQLIDQKKEATQLGFEHNGWEFDNELNSYLPSPIKIYPPRYYREVQYAE